MLFSRFLVIVILILLQVAVITLLYTWLSSVAPWIVIFRTAFEFVMIIYLFNNSMDSAAKLTWMFVMALFPLPGAFFLWFTQSNTGNKKLK